MELYLFRHGQGGPRGAYDALSDVGRRQAQLLGAWLRTEGLRFDAAIAGTLRRQRETAEIALGAMRDAPALDLDPRWDEFSLDRLWTCLAPRLRLADESFASRYAEVGAAGAHTARAASACDGDLIGAWVNGACEDGMESWADFQQRIESPRSDYARRGAHERVAVFTSATPTGIWCGRALQLDERHILRIAGVLYNSSFTTFRLDGSQLRLISLNNTPHLRDPALLTVRGAATPSAPTHSS